MLGAPQVYEVRHLGEAEALALAGLREEIGQARFIRLSRGPQGLRDSSFVNHLLSAFH